MLVIRRYRNKKKTQTIRSIVSRGKPEEKAKNSVVKHVVYPKAKNQAKRNPKVLKQCLGGYNWLCFHFGQEPHDPEPTTLLCSYNGVLTDRFIFRLNFPRINWISQLQEIKLTS